MNVMNKIPPQLAEKIAHFATFPQTGVSLRQMVKFGQKPSPGTLLRASQFLADELPIRLAHRVVELERLPHNLSEMPSVLKVKHWYAQSFQDLIEFPKPSLPREVKERLRCQAKEASQAQAEERDAAMRRKNAVSLPEASPNPSLGRYVPTSPSSVHHPVIPLSHRYFLPVDDIDLPPDVEQYNVDFTKMISAIKRRHNPVVTTIAQGVLEYKEARRSHIIDMDVQAFLDRFYMSRIGIRMLIGQHIALQNGPFVKDHVGVICTKTNLAQIAQEAIDNAKFVCDDHYGLFKGPQVILHCRPDLEFMYVPSHLHHMLFELLKNSLRAVVELTGPENEEKGFPPVKIIVAEGKEDITVKVSDEGGGIPRSGMPLVWTYMYTTATAPTLDQNFHQTDFKAPLAGFGYGLPISRLYSRYFGGDLKVISMEGFGTDAYLNLCRLSDSEEPVL